MTLNEIKDKIDSILEDEILTNQVLIWHNKNQFIYFDNLCYVLNELLFHFELKKDIKVDIMTNTEFLKTYLIRKNGLEILPKDWINHQTKEIDNKILDDLWLEPTKGYLVKILEKSTDEKDKHALERILNSKSYQYRGLDKTIEERREIRIAKLQNSINQNKIAIFLGRQNRVYKNLQNLLNEKYKDKFWFVSDHTWSSSGYTEPAMKASDNRLSVIQACETIKRLPELRLKGERINERFIMFTLDSYEAKVSLAAMYSNPNLIARSYQKPPIDGIEKFEFAYTGLTDLELANIVRNKDWFELTQFCRTNQNGELEELSKKQVSEEYGIKYIGDLLKNEY